MTENRFITDKRMPRNTYFYENRMFTNKFSIAWEWEKKRQRDYDQKFNARDSWKRGSPLKM